MDIQSTAISAKLVIQSLIKVLENEGVDAHSIKFKIGSTEEGCESEDLDFGKLIDLTLKELEEVKDQAVQEWISVEDKEPDCGETVLICWSDSPEVEPEKDYMDIDIDTGALYWSNYNDGDEPSHWMPLPKVIELQEPANA